MISRIASIVYWMTFAYTLRYIVKYFGRYRQTRSFSLGLVPGRTYFILAYPDHIELFYDVWFNDKFSFTAMMDGHRRSEKCTSVWPVNNTATRCLTLYSGENIFLEW